MPQAQLLPPIITYQFTLCLSPTGSQRQESLFCVFTGQFPGTESWVENMRVNPKRKMEDNLVLTRAHYNLIHNKDINFAENVPQAFLKNQQLLIPK